MTPDPVATSTLTAARRVSTRVGREPVELEREGARVILASHLGRPKEGGYDATARAGNAASTAWM